MSKPPREGQGMVSPYALLGGAIIALLSFVGFAITPLDQPEAAIRMEPQSGVVLKESIFPVRIMVDALSPVNVFKGELDFDHTKFRVASIDYNTSIAELWAEKPWYANGEGTINFIGGTTREGGFTGSGILMTINFEPIELGEASLNFKDARILAHDGLGSDVTLFKPLDALFTVEDVSTDTRSASSAPTTVSVAIVETMPRTDLNGDGKQTIIDVSIFISGLFSKSAAYDFNGDGDVDTQDLSILMSVK